jgi:LPS O-antigen subunit length determinant protein (WzzB/FepE family)
LKVRALNTGQARRLAQVIFDRLRDIHQALSEAILAETRKQLEQSTQALRAVLAEQEELRKDVSSENLNGAALSPDKALIANVAMASKTPEILDLRKRKFDLEQGLNAAHTYPTSLFDDISVPRKAVFPNKLLTLFLAFVAGGIFGCLVALFRDYAVRSRPG